MSDVLPSKLNSVNKTVVGHGSRILEALQEGALTVGQLWVSARTLEPDFKYEHLVDALTFLYAAGIVDERGGTLVGRTR